MTNVAAHGRVAYMLAEHKYTPLPRDSPLKSRYSVSNLYAACFTDLYIYFRSSWFIKSFAHC